MCKCKNVAIGGKATQKGTSPTPLYHGGEQGDTAQNLMEEVALMEEVFLMIGAPSMMHIRLLITNILQEASPRDYITEGVVLAPRGTILFFRRHLNNEGLFYCDTQNIEHSLTCYVTWARRTTQVKETVNTIQKGFRAIADTVLEKKTKARGPEYAQGSRGAAQSSAVACNVNNLKWGLNEGHPIGR